MKYERLEQRDFFESRVPHLLEGGGCSENRQPLVAARSVAAVANGMLKAAASIGVSTN